MVASAPSADPYYGQHVPATASGSADATALTSVLQGFAAGPPQSVGPPLALAQNPLPPAFLFQAGAQPGTWFPVPQLQPPYGWPYGLGPHWPLYQDPLWPGRADQLKLKVAQGPTLTYAAPLGPTSPYPSRLRPRMYAP